MGKELTIERQIHMIYVSIIICNENIMDIIISNIENITLPIVENKCT